MKNELFKRIFTSVFLLPILFYVTVYSGIYLISILILFYLLSAYEIFKNTPDCLFNLLANILLILSFYSFYYLRDDTT